MGDCKNDGPVNSFRVKFGDIIRSSGRHFIAHSWLRYSFQENMACVTYDGKVRDFKQFRIDKAEYETSPFFVIHGKRGWIGSDDPDDIPEETRFKKIEESMQICEQNKASLQEVLPACN